MYLSTLVTSLFQVFLMIIAGYVVRKLGILSAKGVSELSRLLMALVLPCSIISSGNQQFTPELGYSLLECAALVFVYYSLAFLLSALVYKLFVKDKARYGVSVTMTVFANVGFLGMPLASTLYGAAGLLFAVLYNLFYNFFLAFVGQRFFSGGEKMTIKERLLDPLCVSSVLALLLFISPVKLPSAIYGALDRIGAMMAPMSMIIIGGQLIGTDWKRVFSNKDSYLVCLMRNILLPLIALFALKPFVKDQVLLGTLVLLTALPVGSLNSILAEKHGQDVKYVNQTLVLSMILSLLTIPAVMTLLLG